MTNREEVAKKLREDGEDIEEVSPYPAVALNKITNIIAINEITSYQDFFNRLADLIDPTCELKIQDGHACCGNCGHILAGEYEVEEDYWCFRPYCPDCGARVARE